MDASTRYRLTSGGANGEASPLTMRDDGEHLVVTVVEGTPWTPELADALGRLLGLHVD